MYYQLSYAVIYGDNEKLSSSVGHFWFSARHLIVTRPWPVSRVVLFNMFLTAQLNPWICIHHIDRITHLRYKFEEIGLGCHKTGHFQVPCNVICEIY